MWDQCSTMCSSLPWPPVRTGPPGSLILVKLGKLGVLSAWDLSQEFKHLPHLYHGALIRIRSRSVLKRENYK